MKKLHCFVVIAVLLLACLSLYYFKYSVRTAMSQEQFSQDEKGENSLNSIQAMARRASAEGRSQITVPPVISLPTGVSSLKEIERRFSLLRVKVMDEGVVVKEANIQTWYKLEIVEFIHKQAEVKEVNEESLLVDVPSRLLPQSPSEAFLVTWGGAADISGVRVIQPIRENQFKLDIGREYIIAALLEHGGRLVTPVAEASGIFSILDQNLKGLPSNNDAIAREVEKLYGNRLNELRTDARWSRTGLK